MCFPALVVHLDPPRTGTFILPCGNITSCDSVAPWVNFKVTGEVFVLLQPLHFQNAAQAWSARFISLIAVPHCRRAPVFLLRDYGSNLAQ